MTAARPPRTFAQRSNFWRLTAAGYPAWRARSLTLLSGHDLPLSREATLFLALARPQKGERWLDVGTAAGFYAGVLARAGAEVLAIDISPPMLSKAREREDEPNVDWGLLDIEDSGLESASFDGVTCGATLNELADPARGLREMQRLLRPGGKLWLMYVSRGGGELQALLEKWGGTTFPERSEVAGALTGCDLVSAACFGEAVFELFVRKPEV